MEHLEYDVDGQVHQAGGPLYVTQAHHAELYELAPVALCTLSVKGEVLELNRECTRLFGARGQQIIGCELSRFVTADDQSALAAHLSQCASSEEAVTSDLRLSFDAGEPSVIEMTSARARGPIPSFRTVLTDVTKRTRTEKALRHSLGLRHQFFELVSHDLRNPLNTVLMGADVLLRRAPSTERRAVGRSQLESIKLASRHMVRMLADVLDLSNMEAGRLSIDRRSCDAAALMATATGVVAALARRKSIELTVKPLAAPLLVLCDRERVTQALANLLDNAIAVTRESGAVSVEAFSDATGVVFAVHDAGRGLSPEQLSSLFQSEAPGNKPARAGLSLALSLAKGMVEYLSGHLTATSVVGQGSTFSFAMPAAAAK